MLLILVGQSAGHKTAICPMDTLTQRTNSRNLLFAQQAFSTIHADSYSAHIVPDTTAFGFKFRYTNRVYPGRRPKTV